MYVDVSNFVFIKFKMHTITESISVSQHRHDTTTHTKSCPSDSNGNVT